MKKHIWLLYFILIGLLILSFTSCAYEFSNKELECMEWNEELDKEIEIVRAGFEKLSPSKQKIINRLELLRCEL